MHQGSDMDNKNTVLLVMGSARAARNCPAITAWVEQLAHRQAEFDCEVVDLAAWTLPAGDEPGIPALGHYAQAHTRAWSDKVQSASAVVFVVPQYNWGYPAVLKNAIDHLYREWRNMPTLIVSYGGHGGTRCARQLRRVAASLKMRVANTSPALVLPDDVIRRGIALRPQQDLAAFERTVGRAFKELAALVAGTEPPLSRLRRTLLGAWFAAT
ncbi:Chromate reductase [Xylophilus ampelinus]|nr:Chromate reductase [Xylophilus ampelinus]